MRKKQHASHDETNGWIFTKAAHEWMDRDFKRPAGMIHASWYGGVLYFKRVSYGLPEECEWLREET